MTDQLRRAHRLLCGTLIDEAMFRAALGDGRANIGTVARYLALPAAARPALTPFFDPLFYRIHNRDLAAETDLLLDFLGRGLAAWRDPHPLIELRHIAEQDAGLLGAAPSAEALAAVLDGDRADPSPYFDREFYAAQLESARPSGGLLRHFLTEGLAAGLRPNRWLDLDWYVRSHDDVPADRFAALRHFVVLGDPLGRAAGPLFDGALYQRRYTDVADARMPPLRHFLAHGRHEGRQAASDRPRIRRQANGAAPAPDPGTAAAIEPAGIVDLHARLMRRLDDLRHGAKDAVRARPPPWLVCRDPARDLARLALPAPGPAPLLSILVPAHDQVAHTVACLLAIAANPPACAFEVVLVDDGSREPLYARLGDVANLVLLRLAPNAGFVRACNAGYARCRGAFVLLLNNDAQPLAGAIERLIAALRAEPALAAAGPMIVYPNGRLQEAGCFLRPDGESGMVGLFADPDHDAYGFDRDVAYCSGAALMLRRAAVGDRLFDEAYAPAYCEDADLCLRLRAAGHGVRYVAAARVVHHLSASEGGGQPGRRQRRVARNQATLQARWGDMLAAMDRVRPIVFYLPQFHPTPQNDLWWGSGFTEWTNVARAQPSYAGHYQPHLPADMGFYDLRVADALRRQAALAARYGIAGFCVYHYDFGGQRMLHEPMAVLHANPDIPFRHCLCWANENWTRNWDGGRREVLIEQRSDAATLAGVIADAVRHAADPRYIRVNGCPLFLVYRPLQLPDPPAFAARLREAFRAAGFPGAHLVYVESMEAADQGMRPADLGFDAAVEFPPHGRAVAAEDAVTITKAGWSGYRYDYPETVLAFLGRAGAPYRRYPAVFPSWDNTPRQPLRGTSFDGAQPAAFAFYVEQTIEAMRGFLLGEERLLFVNAWNEWAEGAHLEPDSGFGHGWLEALRHGVQAKAWH